MKCRVQNILLIIQTNMFSYSMITYHRENCNINKYIYIVITMHT